MNGVMASFLRELRAYFFSPLAYTVLTLLLLINGIVFWIIISFLSDPRAGIAAPLELLFGGTGFFWFVLLIVAPVLTMRLVAEERRSGTIEVLMTAPVTEGQVIAGKYLAALVFYIVLWLPTLVYALILQRYHEVDWGPVFSGYLGVIAVGALFLAIGLFASSLCRSQLVAALLTFAILLPLVMLDLFGNLFNDEAVKQVIAVMNPWAHMDEFKKGIIDTRRIVFYLSTTLFLLFLSARALAAKKWR